MGRALTGRRWERNGRFYGRLPTGPGATTRVEAGFATAGDRDAWLAAGIAALKAGRVLSDPRLFHRGRPDGPPANGGPPMPAFETLAHGWLDEYYRALRRGNAERERDVRVMVETHLIPALTGPIPADPAVARTRLVELVRRLAAEPGSDGGPGERPFADRHRLVTIAEATAVCGRSESTIRRALRSRRLPGARRGPDGQWRIPMGDLAAAGLGQVALMPQAMSRAYVTDILWAHAKILEWGRFNGWPIPDFARDVNALTPDQTVARTNPDTDLRRPLAVAEVARVAAHLHVVHQLVLWLMRILGVRIGEAFGPRVGDVVDLGEVGLIFIHRQGGRKYRTRTRTGVETAYSKDTLKRQASHRVVVVPGPLLALIRVVIEAFHTDPDRGVVDLDARLVPWIGKQGRGQSAFRAALDAALAREGFDLDTSGFEITTHDLRKSLATDLAWNGELDELAKRRVMGHKAGDDVFARIYTLDHPTLAPLAAVAAAVEANITASVPTLLVPTERRVAWAAGNPLRERTVHLDAVLAAAGWQIEAGDADNPWCDTARAAAELDLAVTTTRRWMRDQVVPSTTVVDEYGNPQRRARLADVRAVKAAMAGRVLLRDLAEDAGVGYHRAWRTLKRLDVEPDRDPRTDELVLHADQAASVRAEFHRLGELARRSLRVSAAAITLGVPVAEVTRLLRRRELDEDPERDAFDARYVTTASVEALRAARAGRPPAVVGVDVVSLAAVVELTGLTPGQVAELTDRGVLDRRDVRRHFHVTTASLRRWAVGYRPDLLVTLDTAADQQSTNTVHELDRTQPATAEPTVENRGCEVESAETDKQRAG